MSTEPEQVYVVDRIEGELAILVGDDGSQVDVLLPGLPLPVSEGTVLRVTCDSEGNPDWASASIDEDEAERRKAEAEEILDDLRRRDPGGDIKL